MKKTSVLMVLGNTGRGGAQTFAMNLLRMIDKEKYQIDFAVNEIRKNGYTQEMYKLGSKIYEIPFFKGYNWGTYVKTWDRLLSEHHYDIVHGHVSSSASIYLKEARRHGCKTIAHSHSAGYRGNWIERQVKKVFTVGVKSQADYWFACSKLAAERLFGQNYANYAHYYDIPNAIIADNYLFCEESRNLIRSQNGINFEQRVYGHVGSFTAPKNHEFLLEVFSRIAANDPKAVLVICGDGERESEIQARIESLKISEKVLLVGNVANVNEYMMAMDAMIFPSFFEGFPVTILEAQAAGLPIVLSDTITDEVFLTDCIHPMSLSSGAEAWASKAMKLKSGNRVSMNAHISASKYNMKNCVEQIENIYCEMVKRK